MRKENCSKPSGLRRTRLTTKVIAMNPTKKIKIIKNARREDSPKAAEERVESSAGQPDSNRVIAGRVSAWVREFQQRRLPDPRRAFAGLFVAPGT
jgi:xanthine dehydrogenase iron-sulfur cluster and FAD-binding subunit A